MIKTACYVVGECTDTMYILITLLIILPAHNFTETIQVVTLPAHNCMVTVQVVILPVHNFTETMQDIVFHRTTLLVSPPTTEVCVNSLVPVLRTNFAPDQNKIKVRDFTNLYISIKLLVCYQPQLINAALRSPSQ